MNNHTTKKPHLYFKTISPILLVCIACFCMLIFPKDTVTAARGGLDLWLGAVVPSLLPFLVGTNLLAATGFVQCLGVLLEPIMTPLFRVPGCGGFALAAGVLSGYPTGARVTATLVEQKSLTKPEAARLLSFVNNASPLFLTGTVGAGLFLSAGAGTFFLAVHYLSALSTGLMFRFAEGRQPLPYPGIKPPHRNPHLFKKAFRALRIASARDDRPFGTQFGDSVQKATETLLLIGGFIVCFSVLVQLLRVTKTFAALAAVTEPIYGRFNLSKPVCESMFYGLLEVTTGVRLLAEQGLSRETLVASAAVLSFGGFSIHAQALSFLGRTGIRPRIYLLGKFVNACFAVFYGIVLFSLFGADFFRRETVEAAAFGEKGLDRFFCSSVGFARMVLFLFAAGCAATFYNRTHCFIRKKFDQWLR